jgi:tRNA A-37 threonylcarbamoyl transferase component Bud32
MNYFANTTPFTVTLNCSAADNSICCEQLLRNLPGKRLVYRGTWQQHSVIVKLFLDSKSSHRHWAREQAGIEALEKARALTPELIFSGQLTDSTPILVFECLPDAQTALAVWDRLTTLESKSGLLRQLTTLVGCMHDKGLVQEDLHLENFLISGGQIYAIDGDTICSESGGEPLNLKASSRNLALLFAQLPPTFDSLIEPTSQHYAKCRSISHSKLMVLLEADLPKVRRRRRCKYVKKSYRTCSEFIRSNGIGQIAISRRDAQGEALSHLLDDPDVFMRNGKVLKDGNTTTIVRVQVGDCDWVIKRYNIKGFWHVLSRCCRSTRAWLSWGNAHRLKISGISTPRAVAMIEKRIGPLRSTGYYISDFVDGPRAEVFFKDDTVNAATKDQAARGFVLLFELFQKLGIHHGDCKAANFLPNEKTPWVLDLDAMHECCSKARFKRLFLEDRQRFLLNWRSQPELLRWFDEHLPK